MAIKNKRKEKHDDWKDWKNDEPDDDEEIVTVGDVTIQTIHSQEVVLFKQGCSEIKIKIDDLDDIIDVLAEED